MKKRKLSTIVIALMSFFLLTGFFGDKLTPEETRKERNDMRTNTLNELYKHSPDAKKEIQSAAGYAVFSNIGINVFLLSTGNGKGVAHDNKSGKDIYMKMFTAGLGVGLGIKDFRGVFIFSNEKAFNQFINKGWQADAQADLAAKSDDKGGEYSGAFDVAPGVKLYQMTENGLAVQATIQGTKYWKDEELN